MKAKSRRYPPDRSAYLREHFQLLCDAGMEMARVEADLQEPPDQFRETLLSRGPTMFMKVGEEIKAPREALVRVLHAAVQAGLPEAYLREAKEIILGQCFGAFRRALTGEPPAGRGTHACNAQVRSRPLRGES